MRMGIDEKYFEKLKVKCCKYYYFVPAEVSEIVGLAREIAKYTDDERKVTRILNGLERAGVYSLEELKKADLEVIARTRNIGTDAVNIIRQIKGLPLLTYTDVHPFAKNYRVYFYSPEKGDSWYKDFHTLKELSDYFNSDECKQMSINYISEILKGE